MRIVFGSDWPLLFAARSCLGPTYFYFLCESGFGLVDFYDFAACQIWFWFSSIFFNCWSGWLSLFCCGSGWLLRSCYGSNLSLVDFYFSAADRLTFTFFYIRRIDFCVLAQRCFQVRLTYTISSSDRFRIKFSLLWKGCMMTRFFKRKPKYFSWWKLYTI